jgi:uncharacterized SAM-binding protein YcdF (DUF218 family)
LEIALVKIFRNSLMLLGVILTAAVLVALTRLPLRAKFWLAEAGEELSVPPAYIVVLGSGDIPNPEQFMRTYYGAEAARKFSSAVVIASLPTATSPKTSGVGVVRDELVLRGVAKKRIRLMFWAYNTREEALRIQELLGPKSKKEPILLVTSPEHIKRAVLVFRKAGFVHVSSVAAKAAGGPCCSGEMRLLRYGLWQGLHDEISVVRELRVSRHNNLPILRCRNSHVPFG